MDTLRRPSAPAFAGMTVIKFFANHSVRSITAPLLTFQSLLLFLSPLFIPLFIPLQLAIVVH